jgi:hypothetical protein
MSVLIIGKFEGDTAKFSEALQTRGQEFQEIGERAKTQGAIHHRFGLGDGFVVVIDEWGSVEQFQSFFSDPQLQEFIASTGALPGPPELLMAEATPSPDEF